LTSTTPVNPSTCNTTAPTQDGGRSGSSKIRINLEEDSLSTLVKIERSFLLRIKETKKPMLFMLKPDMVEETRLNFGRFTILTRWVMKLIRRRVIEIKTPVLLSMNHSTSDQNFQCRESLNVSEQVILHSRNGQRIERLSNSNSTQSPRPLTT
jgi:hypothetical protein